MVCFFLQVCCIHTSKITIHKNNDTDLQHQILFVLNQSELISEQVTYHQSAVLIFHLQNSESATNQNLLACFVLNPISAKITIMHAKEINSIVAQKCASLNRQRGHFNMCPTTHGHAGNIFFASESCVC